MKSKDQILLENIYSKKVLKENIDGGDRHGYFPDDYGNEPLDGVDPSEIYPEIKLIVKDGYLCTPYEVADKNTKEFIKDLQGEDFKGDAIELIGRGMSGDGISASWPNYDKRDLRSLLYDARETGQIPANTEYVILPDGSEFTID